MAISEQSIDAAIKRGAELANAEHKAISARFDAASNRLIIEFDNGVQVSAPMSLLGPSFATPDSRKLSNVRVEGGGYDLYWPELDEGLYIPDLCADVTYGKLAA